MNIDDVCKGRIAVVGNGPVTEEQREKINNSYRYDCIVRFNDRKKMRKGEHTTVHAVRDIPDRKRKSIVSMFLFLSTTRMVPGIAAPETGVFVQPVTARFNDVRKQFEGHAVLNPILVGEKGGTVESRSYFENCDACRTVFDCNSNSSKSGPSTGTAIIEALDNSQSTTTLDVFGMNWLGGRHHFDFAQPDLVSTCCDKCIIHPTATKEY